MSTIENIKVVNGEEFLEITPPIPAPVLVSRKEIEDQIGYATCNRNEQIAEIERCTILKDEFDNKILELKVKLAKFTPVQITPNEESLEVDP